MKHIEWSWFDAAGVSIYAQGWLPELPTQSLPRAVVLLQHGLGEHSGRYGHVAQFFTDNNIVLLANDRAGHGKSGGKRGHIAKYEYTLQEIEQLHTEATRRFPKVPVFLYGHSMGGGIVLNYLLRKKNSSIRGIIATAPALRPAFEPAKLVLLLGKVMRSIYGGFVQGNQLDVTKISRDAAVVAAYKNDSLVHDRLSAETGLGLLEWGEYALAHVSEVSIPLLLIHGSADGLTSLAATQEFASRAKGDVTLRVLDGLYHEVHNEPEQKQVLEDMVRWVSTHLK